MTTQTTGESAAPTITVHPHGELTVYFTRSYGGIDIPIEPGITIEALLDRLGIPRKEVWLVAKNGETCPRDVTLDAGDTIELFAPVAGG
ncbi:MAG: MoaD/ThiS family protein [Chloroflexi bacterium]|nr:MoaD/ThiS family protein [Chloroflexota bacterium]